MIFKIIVSYYDGELTKEAGFCFGESFSDVANYAANYYGENSIDSITIVPFSPDRLLMFDCEDEDEHKAYTLANTILENRVLW